MGAGGGGSRQLRCELCGSADFGVCSISGVKKGGVYLLEGMKAAVKVDSEAEVEVCEKCLEGFVGVVVDVYVPGLEEGGIFCFVEFLCNF